MGGSDMEDYGIYTAADANFFSGVVVHLHSLRAHGYTGKLAVIDTGLDPWMKEYLERKQAIVIPMDFVKSIRFTDVKTDENAGMRGWSFKAFGIMHARLFKRFTFIDADYIPLCNLQAELYDRIERGEFLSTEDGENTWDESHHDAIGVEPGSYMNINAGFFSLSLDYFEFVMEEWRNVMTRRKPFELWYGDQGALNAILDKYSVPKTLVGHKADWNQTWLNEKLAKENLVVVDSFDPPILRHKNGNRIYGWHGCGWSRYWHCIGIDHYRQNVDEIVGMQRESVGKIPRAVLEVFGAELFREQDLTVQNHRLCPAAGARQPLQQLFDQLKSTVADLGTLEAKLPAYERLLAVSRDLDIAVLQVGLRQGGSLQLWEQYFSRAEILGMDLTLESIVPAVCQSSRIKLIEGIPTGSIPVAGQGPDLDIVIDATERSAEAQSATLQSLAGRLRPGGLYVIQCPASDVEELARVAEMPELVRVDWQQFKLRDRCRMLAYRKVCG